MNRSSSATPQQELHHQRWELLERINRLSDAPLVVLSFIWLILLILDFTTGLSPFLQTASNVIWGVFIFDFLVEFLLAPQKLRYLRQHWLTVISLVLPALRVFRVFRALQVLRWSRTVRSLSLLRLLTALNRGMGALGEVLRRRGVGYIVALTLLVTLAGAAGMFLFERDVADDALNSYGDAVWWTAMIMTSLGSEYWPRTAEGRVLGWLLSLYALATFGYITATLASFFIGQDSKSNVAAGERATTEVLLHEIRALRAELAATQHTAVDEPSADEQAPPLQKR